MDETRFPRIKAETLSDNEQMLPEDTEGRRGKGSRDGVHPKV